MGWTDEEKVRIKDENVYLKPETREDSLEEAEAQSREEVASRYFVFSILQGVLNDGRILKVPEKINVLTPSPYLIFSIVPDIPKAGIIALDLYRSEDHIAFHKRCICALNNIRKSSIPVVFQPPVCHGKDQVWGRC